MLAPDERALGHGHRADWNVASLGSRLRLLERQAHPGLVFASRSIASGGNSVNYIVRQERTGYRSVTTKSRVAEARGLVPRPVAPAGDGPPRYAAVPRSEETLSWIIDEYTRVGRDIRVVSRAPEGVAVVD